MENSIAVLKPFGRFLELGKRDFYQNGHPSAAIAAQRLVFRDRHRPVADPAPDLAQALLGEMSDGLAAGTLRRWRTASSRLPRSTARFA